MAISNTRRVDVKILTLLVQLSHDKVEVEACWNDDADFINGHDVPFALQWAWHWKVQNV